MNRIQKISLASIILITLWLILALICWLKGLSALAFAAVLMTMALSSITFSSIKTTFLGKTIILSDEDKMICKNANLVAYRIHWYYFGIACLLALLIIGIEGALPIGWLFTIFFVDRIVFNFVLSITFLFIYGRESKGKKLDQKIKQEQVIGNH